MKLAARLATIFLLAGAVTATRSNAGNAIYFLNPPDTVFQLNGKVGLAGPECYLSMTGKTSPAGFTGPAGYITSVVVSPVSKRCRNMGFIGLPWPISIGTKNSGYISGIGYENWTNACVAPPAPLLIHKNDNWSLNGSSSCFFLFGIKPTPAIVVAK